MPRSKSSLAFARHRRREMEHAVEALAAERGALRRAGRRCAPRRARRRSRSGGAANWSASTTRSSRAPASVPRASSVRASRAPTKPAPPVMSNLHESSLVRVETSRAPPRCRRAGGIRSRSSRHSRARRSARTGRGSSASPTSGSWRSGTPAICRWPTRPVGRYWRIFIATSPSTIWQWYRSICTFRFGAPTSATIACASSCRFRKKPGMSRVLIGSISTSMPRTRRLRCSPCEVGDVGGAQLRALDAGRRQAGHHVHARAAQRVRVGQRLLDAAAEFVFAAGQAGQCRARRRPSRPAAR